MDEKFLEQASDLANAEVLKGIAKARVVEAPPPGFSGVCACGDEIPEKRIALGYYRCVECQTSLEKRGPPAILN